VASRVFEGKRELFRGFVIESSEESLAVNRSRDPWVARPVFHLGPSSRDFCRMAIENVLGEQLEG